MGRWLLVLLCVSGVVLAGQPEKTKTQEWSGTAPIGAYTSPANFSAGRSPGAGMTALGIEVTRDQLTNPATEVELVVEVSYDGGTSWPPDCLPAPSPLCHDQTQDTLMSAQTNWCMRKVSGGILLDRLGVPETISYMECVWNRATDTQTRTRYRLIVRGADASGTVRSTWR